MKWAFGLRYYNPWSEVQHSTFHLLDALIIVMNFTIIFLQGPAQEVVGLLVILRLWRLVKLLGGQSYSRCPISIKDLLDRLRSRRGSGRIEQDIKMPSRNL
jgi:hypothetical protein